MNPSFSLHGSYFGRPRAPYDSSTAPAKQRRPATKCSPSWLERDPAREQNERLYIEDFFHTKPGNKNYSVIEKMVQAKTMCINRIYWNGKN